jgi:hypothetical protein
MTTTLPLEEQLQALKDNYSEQLQEYEKKVEYFQGLRDWVATQLTHIQGLLNGQNNLPDADLLMASSGKVQLVKQPKSEVPEVLATLPVKESNESSFTVVQSLEGTGGEEDNIETEVNTLQVLPQYQLMRMSEAILEILSEKRNADAELITQTLYGDLSQADLAHAILVVKEELQRGVEEKLWLTSSEGFTLEKTPELKTRKTTKARPRAKGEKSSTAKRQQKAVERVKLSSMKAHFQDKSLFEAIESVLKANPGQPFDANLLAEEIYDNLSEQKIASVKKTLQSTLSSGYLQGKWQRQDRGTYVFNPSVPV